MFSSSVTRSPGLLSIRRARTSNALGPSKKAYVLAQIDRSAEPATPHKRASCCEHTGRGLRGQTKQDQVWEPEQKRARRHEAKKRLPRKFVHSVPTKAGRPQHSRNSPPA